LLIFFLFIFGFLKNLGFEEFGSIAGTGLAVAVPFLSFKLARVFFSILLPFNYYY